MPFVILYHKFKQTSLCHCVFRSNLLWWHSCHLLWWHSSFKISRHSVSFESQTFWANWILRKTCVRYIVSHSDHSCPPDSTEHPSIAHSFRIQWDNTSFMLWQEATFKPANNIRCSFTRIKGRLKGFLVLDDCDLKLQSQSGRRRRSEEECGWKASSSWNAPGFIRL